MKFFNQIKVETRNILKSKFLLIISILIVLSSIAVPIINVIAQKSYENNPDIMPMGGMVYEEKGYTDSRYYGGDEYQESITVDGITITNENPFFWNISSLMDEKEYMVEDLNRFSTPAVLDLTIELMDAEIDYYVGFAKHITTQQDYRADLAWSSTSSLYDKFIYEHYDVAEDVLLETMQNKMGLDQNVLKEKYLDITAEERLKTLDSIDEKINTIFEVVENNDFPKFVDLQIGQENDRITDLQEQIAIQEQAIIDNPSQEENLNAYIDDLNKQIENVQTNTIPIWEYRLEKNIIPSDNSWQNQALSDIENNRNRIMYTNIITEEQFNEERYLAIEYKTYAKYTEAMQKQIDEANNTILIAQNSLDADKPDMKYVRDGARSKTAGFLGYSIFVALFAILVGGWLMAREFQQGTIRLLMIRPKTRTKILMSKFLAALLIGLAMYLAGSILNIITNGICYGFSDFAFPNYTVSGEVNFFMYYIPKFLACSVSIIFAFSVAFMLSVVTRNSAISIAVPIASFIGCSIAMAALAYSRAVEWLIYTPIPYVQISSFYTEYSPVKMLMERGISVSLTYGIILLLALSVICTFISIYVFKKKDITN